MEDEERVIKISGVGLCTSGSCCTQPTNRELVFRFPTSHPFQRHFLLSPDQGPQLKNYLHASLFSKHSLKHRIG